MLALTYLYILAAAAGLLLGGYSLLAGGGRILRWRIAGVMAAVAVWSISYLLIPTGSSIAGLTVLVELLLLFTWYLLIERLLRGPYLQSMPEQVRRGARWIWALVLLACVATLFPLQEVVRGFPDADVYLVALLILDLLALALAAQFFGEATIDQESSLKLICLAAVLVVGSQAVMTTVSLLSLHDVTH